MGWPLVASYGCPFFFSASLSNEKASPPGWVRPYGKCYARLEKFLGRKEMLNLGKLALIFLAAVVVLALTPTAGWGQNVYGSLTGIVTDSSGAAIANATVTLTNKDNAEKRTIETDASGNYTFVNILPGRYNYHCADRKRTESGCCSASRSAKRNGRGNL